MNTLILKEASRFLITVILLYSFFIFFRGHNHPGGGFIGGLVAASSWSLIGIAYGRNVIKKSLPFSPLTAATLGLLIALGSGFLGELIQDSFLSGLWTSLDFLDSKDTSKQELKVGTPLLFDFGIYLIVFGTVVNIVKNLEEIE